MQWTHCYLVLQVDILLGRSRQNSTLICKVLNDLQIRIIRCVVYDGKGQGEISLGIRVDVDMFQLPTANGRIRTIVWIEELPNDSVLQPKSWEKDHVHLP